jgi:hypothetical protein
LKLASVRLRLNLENGSALRRFFVNSLDAHGPSFARESLRALVISGWLSSANAPTARKKPRRKSDNLYVRIQLPFPAEYESLIAVAFAEMALEKLLRTDTCTPPGSISGRPEHKNSWVKPTADRMQMIFNSERQIANKVSY